MNLREREIKQVTEALLSGQSLLVLGEPGSGKTTLAEAVRSQLNDQRFKTAIARYSGSAKDLLEELCEHLELDLTYEDDNGKTRNKTAIRLKADLLDTLKRPQTALIADDAHRWPSSLRYWLEDCWRSGAVLLLLGYGVQAKDIFGKLPVVKLEALKEDEVRAVMRDEAERQGVKLSLSELAKLQNLAGNNPAVAKRVIREAALGIQTEHGNDWHFIDGTPLFVAMLMIVGVVRFIGLGLGDKSVYILGGLLTLATIALRSILYAANRGGRKL